MLQNGATGNLDVWKTYTVPNVYVDGVVTATPNRDAAYDAFVNDTTQVIFLNVTAGQTNFTKMFFSGVGFVWKGVFCEAVFLPSGLSTEDLNNLGAYLQAKWDTAAWTEIT